VRGTASVNYNAESSSFFIKGLVAGTGWVVIGWVGWVSNMIPNAVGIVPHVRDE
jgi:hypothetical protein